MPAKMKIVINRQKILFHGEVLFPCQERTAQFGKSVAQMMVHNLLGSCSHLKRNECIMVCKIEPKLIIVKLYQTI